MNNSAVELPTIGASLNPMRPEGAPFLQVVDRTLVRYWHAEPDRGSDDAIDSWYPFPKQVVDTGPGHTGCWCQRPAHWQHH